MGWFIAASLVALVIGIITGIYIAGILMSDRVLGELRIDRSDPDGPYLFLEVNRTIDDICQHRFIMLEVVDKNLASHD